MKNIAINYKLHIILIFSNLTALYTMPELPEVQNMINAIQNCKGQTIKNIYTSNKKLKLPIPSNLKENIINTNILSITRIAKYIIIELSNNNSIILHAGMSGNLFLKHNQPPTIEKHDHVILYFDSMYLVYNDPRRFGLCVLQPSASIYEFASFKSLGQDALSENLTGESFYNKIQSSKSTIKQILLNQQYIAGCGNIYASEALYESRILPTRLPNSLSIDECTTLINNLKHILQQSIIQGGSTLKDYRKPNGESGGFQEFFKVYGKENQSCPRCINNNQNCKINNLKISGRSTFFCINTQI